MLRLNNLIFSLKLINPCSHIYAEKLNQMTNHSILFVCTPLTFADLSIRVVLRTGQSKHQRVNYVRKLLKLPRKLWLPLTYTAEFTAIICRPDIDMVVIGSLRLMSLTDMILTDKCTHRYPCWFNTEAQITDGVITCSEASLLIWAD